MPSSRDELVVIREALAEQRRAGAEWADAWNAAVGALQEWRGQRGRSDMRDEVLIETREAWRSAYEGGEQPRGHRAVGYLADALP